MIVVVTSLHLQISLSNSSKYCQTEWNFVVVNVRLLWTFMDAQY